MIRFTFYLILFIISNSCFAQVADRILFYYDAAGNQTQRTLCINCFNSKSSEEPSKEIATLVEEDLIKFNTEDKISFYPNPVKENLYIKWDLINNNLVSKIEVFSINGKLVKTYSNLENERSESISFQEYPQGTYLVILNYSNNEKKSITILKQ
jgi:hypothetical protein